MRPSARLTSSQANVLRERIHYPVIRFAFNTNPKPSRLDERRTASPWASTCARWECCKRRNLPRANRTPGRRTLAKKGVKPAIQTRFWNPDCMSKLMQPRRRRSRIMDESRSTSTAGTVRAGTTARLRRGCDERACSAPNVRHRVALGRARSRSSRSTCTPSLSTTTVRSSYCSMGARTASGRPWPHARRCRLSRRIPARNLCCLLSDVTGAAQNTRCWARVDAHASSMTWMGVGKVDGTLIGADRSARWHNQAIPARGHDLRYRPPSLCAQRYTVLPGGMLVTIDRSHTKHVRDKHCHAISWLLSQLRNTKCKFAPANLALGIAAGEDSINPKIGWLIRTQLRPARYRSCERASPICKCAGIQCLFPCPGGRNILCEPWLDPRPAGWSNRRAAPSLHRASQWPRPIGFRGMSLLTRSARLCLSTPITRLVTSPAGNG